MSEYIILEREPMDGDFAKLSEELDRYLEDRVGTVMMRDQFQEFNRPESVDYVLVAYWQGTPVACGALRHYSDTEIEVKRFFVQESVRKQGIGDRLLQLLIEKAIGQSYGRMILETGELLTEALGLYQKHGFWKIPNYGQYVNIPESLCMGRSLDGDALVYRVGYCPTHEELKDLFTSVGWMSAQYSHRMEKGFRQAGTLLTVWKQGQLIGALEALDDGELTAYIHYLLVDPAHQGMGVGSRLLELAKERYQKYLYLIVICEEPKNRGFYHQCKFLQAEEATVFQIVNP